ncbi:tyrosine-type recombinase/integrase [Paenarthrobacter nitroguajacolicus]|uniref:tyrosine-type recombinase/integrase n=1 Tax=Paenarthrobacter nitroguajacolicus TaxID=211146 RepID=UPI000AA2B2BF|nr:tyrosine-type recombinase/integrase [Paenarthrobacter nitroguajacolicus]
MELEPITARRGNEQRHGHVIAAWKLAQSSPHTLRAYSRSMTDYCSWLDARGMDLLTVKRPIIDGYRHTLAGSPATVAAKLAALSSFYRYAVSADAITGGNPVELVKRPKVDADHSSTAGMTKDQARALLAAARADGTRSHALVSLLLFTGIRLSEALNASTTDYGHDTGHRTLSIRRKGGKDGKVAVPAPAVEALNAYLGTTGRELVAGAAGSSLPLFTTATGKRWASSEAFRTVQRLARAAGVEGKISPHSLRHTFATVALDAGATLHDLQDSMGHADPRTTRRYDRARSSLEKAAGYDVARALA